MATAASPRTTRFSLKTLIGSGDQIALFTVPFAVAGVIANIAFPSFFAVGGPPFSLQLVSVAGLAIGVATWAWSAFLIVTRVPRGELITTGPFAVVRHPLYTGVSLLVLPFAGFLLNTWLGLALGVVMYAGVRLFARTEEESLARAFGVAWSSYTSRVWISWL
jgi:protein-S-isoprenylcysteine O-methyltransferase Ste14